MSAVVEFGVLTRLTMDERYEAAAKGALRAIWARRSRFSLLGNHIDVHTGQWVYLDAGIGPNTDSYYEYLLKAYILFGDEEYLYMFDDAYRAINDFMKQGDVYVDVNMEVAKPTLQWMTALSAFWPGLQVLYGHVAAASRTMVMFYNLWKKYGFIPEAYDLTSGRIARPNLGAYYLRPELAESLMYLSQATDDALWITAGKDIVSSIQNSAWV